MRTFPFTALLCLASVALAQEPSVPKPSTSPTQLTVGLVRYEGHPDWPGFVFARSSKSGELLYITQVFPSVTPAPGASNPVSFVSMTHDAPNETLVLVDSTKKTHRVSIREKERGSHWPVRLELVSTAPLKVRLTVPNLEATPLALDSPTVCASGEPENSVFVMEVGGEKVPYQGMMKKRAPPDSFTVVKPKSQFSVVVDLSGVYTPPPKGTLRVRFESFNHFSKNEVTLVSNVLEIAR